MPQLHQVTFPGGARTQLTFFPDGVAPRPGAVFLPHGESIRLPEGHGRRRRSEQLFRYDSPRGAITLLTDGKSRNGVPVISRARAGRLRLDPARRQESRPLRAEPAEPDSASPARRDRRASGRRSTGARTRRRCSRSDRVVLRDATCGGRRSPAARRRCSRRKASAPVRWLGRVRSRADGHGESTRSATSRRDAARLAAGRRQVDAADARRPGRSKPSRCQPGRPARSPSSSTRRDVAAAAARCAGQAAARRRRCRPASSPICTWHPARNEVGVQPRRRARRSATSIRSTSAADRLERWTCSEMAGAQSRNAAGRGDRQVEELRRPRDLRRALPAAGAVHRAAAGDHQRARRARSSASGRAPSAAATTSATSSASR